MQVTNQEVVNAVKEFIENPKNMTGLIDIQDTDDFFNKFEDYTSLAHFFDFVQEVLEKNPFGDKYTKEEMLSATVETFLTTQSELYAIRLMTEIFIGDLTPTEFTFVF